jgi:NTP pyrophosphatase (non-canonical NTP hydrolase)
MTDTASLTALTRRLIEFRDRRDWRQFHGLKDLILSASVEAGELLELAQWKTEEDLQAALSDPAFREKLADEVADVFIYLLLICERSGIDLTAAAAAKITKNAAKYPVEKARGNSRKYTEL